MSSKLKYLFLLLLVLPVTGISSDISPKEVIEKAEEVFYSKKTFFTVFEETYIWELTGEKQTLKGEMLLEGEVRFRISTEDQIIVSDGKTLKTYNRIEKQMLIDNLETGKDDLLPGKMLFSYKHDYNFRLTGTENILEKSCYKILFIPKKGDQFYKEVTVWIDNDEWLPRKIEQLAVDGNRSIYLLKEIKLGVSTTEADFNIIPPEGTEVIDMR